MPQPLVLSSGNPLVAPTPASNPDDKARIDRLEKQVQELLETQGNKAHTSGEASRAQIPGVKDAAKDSKPAAEASKQFEVGKNLKMEGTWKNALWFESPDKAFRWTVGGVLQFDSSFFNAEPQLGNSVGTFNNLVDPGYALQDSFSFRRARLRFSGMIWEQIEFNAQYEFAQALDLRRRTLGISPVPTTIPNNDFDPGDDVGFNEVFLGITKLPYIGTVRIGRHRESLNFVTATNDNNQVWMERGMMFDAFNGDFNFSNGVTVQNTWNDDRIYALFGFFHANNNTNRGYFAVGDGEYAYDGRLTCLPIYDESARQWVHLGIDYSYRNPHQYQLRYRARPMIRSGTGFQTPSVLNTGTIFTPDAQQIGNLEFAAALGRFTFAAEASASWVTNAYTGGLPLADGKLPPGAASRGTYFANGAYVEALYFLTPDHRKYVKDRPGYARVVPSSVFYFMDTEAGRIFNRGAWEVGVRYDYLDLTNSKINGGTGNAVTLCLNWYLNANTRVQTNYSWMDRQFDPSDALGRVNGHFHSFGIRFNMDF